MDKKDVIKITLELIKEKKLEKSSIGEIVKRLESSPGNLYYHFRSKNEIYKEAADYSMTEIIKSLETVKFEKNNQDYLFELTEALIKFLEEKVEILFFLIIMKGSSYLENELNSERFLTIFSNTLLHKNHEKEYGKFAVLKLNMFLGSIYEVLYTNKLLNNKNLSKEEIEEICMTFWGKRISENYDIYVQNDLKVGLL